MDVVDDNPDQIRDIIDELVSLLNDNQLTEVQDIIVGYQEDLSDVDDVEQCIIDGTDYSECVDHLVQSMNQS